MAVSESSLLSSFLLPPAPLAVSLPLSEFTDLFPKSRRDDGAIPVLYRELQKQRAQDIERVKQNISAEIKLGEAQQRHIRRIRQARLRQDSESDLGELAMEAQLFPEHVDERQRKVHNAETLALELAQASKDIEKELLEMEGRAQDLLAHLQTSIGDLSDLRYGRFSKTPGTSDDDLATEVTESLRRIQQLIDG